MEVPLNPRRYKMTAHLITFRPKEETPNRGMPLAELRRLIRMRTANKPVVVKWRFHGYRQASLGDRVFLLLQGKHGPAVIGYGAIAGSPEKTRGQWCIPVSFGVLVDPTIKSLATRGELLALGESEWRTQVSGVSLNPNLANRMEKLVVDRLQEEAAQRDRVLNDGPRANGRSGLPNREDPGASRHILDRLFAGQVGAARMSSLRFLTDSISQVAARWNDRWSVTLTRDFIRLNVGCVEAVVLHAGGVNVLAANGRIPKGVLLHDRRPYKRAAGARLLEIPFDKAERLLPAMVRLHHKALSAAVKCRMPAGTLRAHSPGTVSQAWLELALTDPIPRPDRGAAEAEFGSCASASASVAADLEQEEDAIEQSIAQRTDIGPTERLNLVRSRRGQGVYRRNLEMIEKRCRVTGTADGVHLRASHIKPWAKCTDAERLDGFNGLLLAPHVDHLFDEGYISFSESGELLVSESLKPEILLSWGITLPKAVGRFRTEQRRYLKYHRKDVFRDGMGRNKT